MGKDATALQELILGLKDKATAKRRQAARKIALAADLAAGPALHEAFLKERMDSRTWETQVEMAKALGLIGYREALENIKAICIENKPYDMLTIVAATTYVRLARATLSDASPVLELLKFANFSVAMGAFDTLGYDKMIPSQEQIREIVQHARKFGYETGHGDPRYGVAIAAAGWKGDDVRTFLNECLKSKDEETVRAASSSIKGKYVKHR